MLTEKQRQKIIKKLSTQMSDSEIAVKCGVSRSTVWRIRQDETAKQEKLKRAQSRMKAREKKRVQSEVIKPAVKLTRTIVVNASAPASAPAPAAASTPETITAPMAVMPAATTAPTHVLPKVDVEPVSMGNYFAVQILRGESVKDVAYAVMKAAEAEGILFRKLQILDCISVGTHAFARFRSDLVDLAAVMKSSERGFISFIDGCYRVTFADGRQVKYPTTVMCSVQKAGFGAVFAGPRVIRWAQQFSRPN